MDSNLGDIEIDGFVDAGQDGLEPRPHLLVGAPDLSNLLENDGVELAAKSKNKIHYTNEREQTKVDTQRKKVKRALKLTTETKKISKTSRYSGHRPLQPREPQQN